MSEIESKIREQAYLLWERAGCPDGDGSRFWSEAELQVVPHSWTVECGKAEVSGIGQLEAIVRLTLHHAVDNCVELAETLRLTAEDGRTVEIDTVEALQKFQLWPAVEEPA